MSRRPIILTTAFQRPYAVSTHRGVELLERRHVYGALGEICRTIVDNLDGIPLLAATNMRVADVAALMENCDGVLLPGGVSNVHPSCYGEKVEDTEQTFDPDRDTLERAILTVAYARKLPILGICRGMQMLNVFQGGSLSQQNHVTGGPINHMCSRSVNGELDDEAYTHPLEIIPGTKLAQWAGRKSSIRINSIHEQSIARLGRDLIVEARADDGVIEAIAGTNPAHFVYGVQWHPDCNPRCDTAKALFRAYREAMVGKATLWGRLRHHLRLAA